MVKRQVGVPVVLMAGLIVSATVGCAGSGPTVGKDQPAVKVRKHRDIPYYTGRGAVPSKHCLDVYQPVGRTHAPVLLYVFGGWWKHLGKDWYTHIGRTFAGRGIVTVCINHRLSPKHKHPAHVRDVARAFDWVKRNIHRYGGDPGNVFLYGYSSGGHLTALLALDERYLAEVGRTSDDIRGVICIGGVYRVGATSFIFDGVFDPSPQALIDASPECHVDDDQPPFLVVYAEREMPMYDAQAISFAMKLQEHRSPVRLVRIMGRGHLTVCMGIGKENDPTTRAIVDFVREYSGSAARRPKARWGELGPPLFP